MSVNVAWQAAQAPHLATYVHPASHALHAAPLLQPTLCAPPQQAPALSLAAGLGADIFHRQACVASVPGLSLATLPASAALPALPLPGIQLSQAVPTNMTPPPAAANIGGSSVGSFDFTKEQCAGIIELQQQYQAAGDHQSAAVVAQYAAAGVDLSSYLEAAAEHCQPPKVHDPSRRFSGIVRSWNPDGGFGFIVCSESRAIYNKDIFLHKSEIGHEPDLYKLRRRLEFRDGEPVSFQVEYDDKLKPRAKHVELLSHPELTSNPDLTPSYASLFQLGGVPLIQTQRML